MHRAEGHEARSWLDIEGLQPILGLYVTVHNWTQSILEQDPGSLGMSDERDRVTGIARAKLTEMDAQGEKARTGTPVRVIQIIIDK